MGTTYQVTYAPTRTLPERDHEDIEDLLQAINQSLSTYIETSLISTINDSGDTSIWHPVDDHFAAVFERADVIYRDTEGAFNPAVGPLVNAWGFGPNGAGSTPDEETIDSLLEVVDFDAFQMRASPPEIQKRIPEAQLDFSAIAKGYGVDAVGSLLTERGIESYFIEIGGEILTRGQHPDGRQWRVGIETPDEALNATRTPQAVFGLNDAAIATSGNYRNFILQDGRKIVHILNPLTGYPETTSLLSASVLARDSMTADAYATAFMVMGLEKAMTFVEARDGLDAYFISNDENGNYMARRSSGFPEPTTE